MVNRTNYPSLGLWNSFTYSANTVCPHIMGKLLNKLATRLTDSFSTAYQPHADYLKTENIFRL